MSNRFFSFQHLVTVALHGFLGVIVLVGNAMAKPPRVEHQLEMLGAVVSRLPVAGGNLYQCLIVDEDTKPNEVDTYWTGSSSDLDLLCQLPSLRNLCIGVQSIKPTNLSFVKRIDGLTTLQIRIDRFTSADLQYVENGSINYLYLYRTEVDDGIIQHLRRFPRLILLDLRETKVTPYGLRQLRLRFPHIEILWENEEETD